MDSNPFAVFSVENYGLILISIISQWGIGRALKIRGWITASLVGLCFSGLSLACLANVWSAPIRILAVCWICIGFFVGIRYLYFYQYRKPNVNTWYCMVPVLTAGIFFWWNDPSVYFFAEGSASEKVLLFNRHFSYYAALPVEMLQADYFSRLRILNLYPLEWSRYHFFNGATQALAQALLPQRGLFTYFMVQVMIFALIVGALFEQFLLLPGSKSLEKIFLWCVIGFSFFYSALQWNFFSTGPFSVFGAVLFLWYFYYGRYGAALVFGVILAASAFRISVVILPILVVVVWKVILKNNSSEKLSKVFWAMVLLFFVYQMLTLFSGSPGRSIWSLDVFNQGWWQVVACYKYLGLIFNFFDLPNPFGQFVENDFAFLKMLRWKIWGMVFVVSIVGLSWVILRNGKKEKFNFEFNKIFYSGYFKRFRSQWLLGWFLVLWFLIGIKVYGRNWILLHGMFFIPALWCTWCCWFLDSGKQLWILVLSCQILTLLFQYTGSGGVQVPVVFITLDVFCWSLFALVLKQDQYLKGPFGSWGSISICLFSLLILTSFQPKGILHWTDQSHSMPIGVLQLFREYAGRNVKQSQEHQIERAWENEDWNDAFSSIRGERLLFDPVKSRKLMTIEFTPYRAH